MELFLVGGEAWAGHSIGVAISELKFISSGPFREAITSNVVPSILQADILVFTVRVRDQEAGVKILITAVQALGGSCSGSDAYGQSSHDELFHL